MVLKKILKDLNEKLQKQEQIQRFKWVLGSETEFIRIQKYSL
jgi:hypothetical protein